MRGLLVPTVKGYSADASRAQTRGEELEGKRPLLGPNSEQRAACYLLGPAWAVGGPQRGGPRRPCFAVVAVVASCFGWLPLPVAGSTLTSLGIP